MHFAHAKTKRGAVGHDIPLLARYLAILLVAPITLTIAGCVGSTLKPIESRDQAAGVLVSSTAIPWQDIASNLQPGFQITGATALQQVAPVAQDAQLATLNAIGVNLSAGALVGPFKNPASGSYAATTPSAVPAPQPSTGIPAGATLPTPSTPNAALAIDPMLQYAAANALFQYVQLLNADLSSSILTEDYVPYIVRTRLSVIPYRPDLPYDLFARISFFTPAEDCGQQSEDKKYENRCWNNLPIIVPLLVTDDIQRAASSAAAENARQLALALEILAPYAQGTVNASSVKQQLQSLSGQNYDSILTVGRDNDNTLLVRIGAAYQSTRDAQSRNSSSIGTTRALVGQNYDVATIVLIPRSYFVNRHVPDLGLNIDVNTDFRNTYTGELLPRRPQAATVSDFDQALTEAIPDATGWYWYQHVWTPAAVPAKYEFATQLTGEIASDEFPKFLNTLCTWRSQIAPAPGAAPSGNDDTDAQVHGQQTKNLDSAAMMDCVEQRQGNARILWARLSALTPDSSFTTTSLDLPLVRKVIIPPQSVTVLDDGKTGMQAQLRTQAQSIGGKLVATLTLTGSHPKPAQPAVKGKPRPVASPTPFSIPLLSKGVSFDQTTGILTFQFPSAAGSGITGIDPAGGSVLSVSTTACDLDNAPGTETSCTHLYTARPRADTTTSQEPLTFKVAYVTAPAASGPVPGFTFTSGAKQIVEANGTGTVIVAFPKWGTEDSAVITIDGASVTAASAGTLANGQITLKAPGGAVTLQLLNLAPGVPVTAQAEGKQGGASTGKTSITFNVVSTQTMPHSP